MHHLTLWRYINFIIVIIINKLLLINGWPPSVSFASATTARLKLLTYELYNNIATVTNSTTTAAATTAVVAMECAGTEAVGVDIFGYAHPPLEELTDEPGIKGGADVIARIIGQPCQPTRPIELLWQCLFKHSTAAPLWTSSTIGGPWRILLLLRCSFPSPYNFLHLVII